MRVTPKLSIRRFMRNSFTHTKDNLRTVQAARTNINHFSGPKILKKVWQLSRTAWSFIRIWNNKIPTASIFLRFSRIWKMIYQNLLYVGKTKILILRCIWWILCRLTCTKKSRTTSIAQECAVQACFISVSQFKKDFRKKPASCNSKGTLIRMPQILGTRQWLRPSCASGCGSSISGYILGRLMNTSTLWNPVKLS